MTSTAAPDNRTNISRILYSFDDFLRYLHSHWLAKHTTFLQYDYFLDDEGFYEDSHYETDDAFKQEDQYLTEGAHAASASAWAAQSHFCFGRLQNPVPLPADGGVWLGWYLNDVGIEISMAGGLGYCLLHVVFFEVTVEVGMEWEMQIPGQRRFMGCRAREVQEEEHTRKRRRIQ